MTIQEWLTPDFFALNVILIALLMNLTIYGVVSNFTVDFRMNDRFESGLYASLVIAALTYGFMVILGIGGVIPRFPYLYENKYNFLLLGRGANFGGNGPVLIAIVFGILAGGLVGYIWGKNKSLRVTFAVFSVICNVLIVSATLLWIINQT